MSRCPFVPAPGGVRCPQCGRFKATTRPPEQLVFPCRAITKATAVVAKAEPIRELPWWPKDADGLLIPQAELTAQDMPCSRRGAVVRAEQSCELCGQTERKYDVFDCVEFGECSLIPSTREGRIKDCLKCPLRLTDLASRPLVQLEKIERPAVRPVAPIAVVIPCHNYGPFLEECIASVWNQTVEPAELIVVDDASTDNTAEVCERLGVKRIAVDYRNAHRTRGAGFAATTAEWVCFLDADDTIEPDYLAQATARFTTGVGFVFSDIEQFGAASGRLVYQAGDISTRNFAHAGSVARRIALASAQVFDRTLPGEVLEDWWMWRRVLEAGWQAVKSPAIYRYRRHEGSRSKELSARDPVAVAGLSLEDITIAIPLSGRRIWWPRMRGWLEQQTWPRQQTRLLIVDTSDDERFAANVRSWLANNGYPSTQYVAMRPADPGIADADRHQHAVYRGVQAAMPRIYNRVRHEVTTPYVLIVEDDILPPVDVAERLLKSFDQDTVSVSGSYRSRYQDNYIAWTKGLSPIVQAGDGVEIVGGNGFGCVMLRTSVLKQTVLHHGGRAGDFDPNFYADIDPRWVAKLDWSVRCDHAGLAA